MNEKKADKSSTILSYSSIERFLAISILLLLGSLALIIFIVEGSTISLWWYLFLSIVCLVGIYLLIDSFAIDFKILFDNKGFTIIKRNRINSIEDKLFCRWEDVKYLEFVGLHSKYSEITLKIRYKRKVGWETMCFGGIARYSKFKKLAKQYSGRDDIIKEYWKRKPFEFDKD